MNTLDIILILPVVFGLAKGLWAGLVQELAGLIGIAGGLVAAWIFAPQLDGFLTERFEWTPQTANVAAFIIVFVVVFLVVMVLARVLSKGLSWIALGPLNRGLGGVFGAAKYTLFTIIALTAFDRINQKIELVEKQTLKSSWMYTGLIDAGDLIWEAIPPEGDLRQSIENGLDAR